MALRRPALPWQKYFRFGGFLLVIVLVISVLGAFIIKSMQHMSYRVKNSTMGVMPMEKGSMNYTLEQEMMDIGRSEKMMALWGTGMDGVAPIPAMESPMITSVIVDRKLAKSASLDLRAESLAWTTGKIQEIVRNIGGYVESANVSEPKVGIKTGWMTVRVPSDRLDTALDEIKKAASAVMSESMNASDVTDQSIDLAARLNAKQAEEGALVSLLKRAEKVSDVIEITSRLTIVRAEIERMEVESRMLEGQVAMSSIMTSVTEDPRAIANTEPVRNGNVFKRSLADLYQFGIALGSGLVMLVVSGLPVILVYGLFLWGAYRLGRFVARRVVDRE